MANTNTTKGIETMTTRTTVQKFACDLEAGDIVLSADGELVVSSAEWNGAFTIVDFADGTATPPLQAGTWMEVAETSPEPKKPEQAPAFFVIAESEGVGVTLDWSGSAPEVRAFCLGRLNLDRGAVGATITADAFVRFRREASMALIGIRSRVDQPTF